MQDCACLECLSRAGQDSVRQKGGGMEKDRSGYKKAWSVGFKINGSYLIRVVDESQDMEWTKQFSSNRAHNRCLYQPDIMSRLVLITNNKQITN